MTEQTVMSPRRIRRLAAGVVAVVIAGCSSGPSGTPGGAGPASGTVVDMSAPGSGAQAPTGRSPGAGTPGEPGDAGRAGAPATSPERLPSATGSTPAGSSAPAASGKAAGPADGTAALLAAADTALGTVPGGTVISVESERGGRRWEVDVITPDGTAHEVVLSGDGATVVSGPTVQRDTAASKAKHLALLAAAKLDYRAAVDKLSTAMPGGRIGELDLDTDRGVTVWEADVYDGAGVKHEFNVHAATGAVTAG